MKTSSSLSLSYSNNSLKTGKSTSYDVRDLSSVDGLNLLFCSTFVNSSIWCWDLDNQWRSIISLVSAWLAAQAERHSTKSTDVDITISQSLLLARIIQTNRQHHSQYIVTVVAHYPHYWPMRSQYPWHVTSCEPIRAHYPLYAIIYPTNPRNCLIKINLASQHPSHVPQSRIW